MDTTTINFYESNASEISQRYEVAASPVERYFQTAFLPGSKILDIGAGSGRDAARLIANGYDAYATDPSAALQQASIALHCTQSCKIGLQLPPCPKSAAHSVDNSMASYAAPSLCTYRPMRYSMLH